MVRRTWECNHFMVDNGIYAHFRSKGPLLTITLSVERGIVPAVHALDWIFQGTYDETVLEILRVTRDPDLESKVNLHGHPYGPDMEYSAQGGYNFILVPEGEKAKIEVVLSTYMQMLKKPGYNGRKNLLVKEVPRAEKPEVMELGRLNAANAVVADDETFLCLRGQSFKGGLQEKIGRRGYKLANIDQAFYF